jgi:methionyl-tRNA synthetase
MEKILITSALPYVNNIPHLGNIIGCVLSADVFARYNRLKKKEVLYVCGTDEYGTATTAKAMEEKISPRELCDKYHKIHKDIYEWFSISFDVFGRTSTDKHTQITQQIFHDLYANNMFIEKEIEQPYDELLKLFLADRYVIGECPHCGSKSARSDQCDQCGKLLTYTELINPISKLSTRHLFLDLSKSEDKLSKWIDDVEKKGLWSQNTISIARAWLNEGLKARSITRDLKWGVPVPLDGWEDKVFYVWFDAPIGYISISATKTDDYMDWWDGSDQIKHYEFIGKDNVPFHAIIFPAMLLGTGKKWTLPYYISSTEFLNYENGKFSKTDGVGVFGNDAKDSGIPSDVWRYYLLSNRPETSDTAFSWDDFGKKLNNELLANYGNLINRTLTFVQNNFDSKVPKADYTILDKEFLEKQKTGLEEVDRLLSEVKIRSAINQFMHVASEANAYFQSNEPWKAVKEDKPRVGTVMNVLLHTIKNLAIASEPFLPNTSKKIFKTLNIQDIGDWSEIGKFSLKQDHSLNKPEHLFKPIDAKTLAMFKKKFSKKQKEQKAETEPLGLENLHLEVGLIKEVSRHPNADKLYVEKIEMANNEIRTICSGLVPYMKEEDLLNKKCLVVKNLKTANLRGVQSQGMVLVAEDKEKNMELISADADTGTIVEFEGIKSLESKEISIEQFFTVNLEVRASNIFANNHKLLINNKPLMTKKIQDGKVS